MGLIGGTGGVSYSIPFLSDAPAGRLTVSITDVVDKNTGSEISDFATDFFRSIPCLIIGWMALGLKAAVFGVVGLETGGVWLAEKEGSGDGSALLKPPGEGRGEMGIPGEYLGRPSRGEEAPDAMPV
jgi:hypothetical protein